MSWSRRLLFLKLAHNREKVGIGGKAQPACPRAFEDGRPSTHQPGDGWILFKTHFLARGASPHLLQSIQHLAHPDGECGQIQRSSAAPRRGVSLGGCNQTLDCALWRANRDRRLRRYWAHRLLSVQRLTNDGG